MPIYFNEETKAFKLDSSKSSYVFNIIEGNIIQHIYYGSKIAKSDISYFAVAEKHGGVCPIPSFVTKQYYSADVNKSEYSCCGTGDFRTNALQIRTIKGNITTDIRYVSHKIYKGKPQIPALPSTYADDNEATTLELICLDSYSGAEVTLFYTVYENQPIITRHAKIRNMSSERFTIERAFSSCVDIDDTGFDLVHLWGKWAKECNFERREPIHGIQTIASKRGCSSHMHNPFVALVSKDATETVGQAYGFSFVYSGNFAADIEKDNNDCIRLIMGINPVDFSWTLDADEEFYTPEVVMAYSDCGIGEMSRAYHKLYRNNLCRGEWKQKNRPVLVNNWEATYFKFDEIKLYDIAKEAAELGVEMFIMDDGWFGKRDNDKSSLGDWFVNEKKLQGGLAPLVDKINALGLKFGIWFEPEMISPISELYEAHPDWCIHITGREKTKSRNQLVLDMSRKEVRDYLFDVMSAVLDSANIEYIKWDFNRPLTEIGNDILLPERQKELPHRYMLGLYELLERLIKAYPHVLLEGCASGGGRFDPAMLYYSPQIWTSDDTDAIERIGIQFGTSIVYPASSMGAHVSAVPNHQAGRITSLKTRGDIAMSGVFGYELDLCKFTDEEKEIVKKQIIDYKKYAGTVLYGDLYRIITPAESKDKAAWIYVSPDKKEAVLTYVVIRTTIYMLHIVKFQGLDPMRNYCIEQTGETFRGDVLMNVGYKFPKRFNDYETVVFHLTSID